MQKVKQSLIYIFLILYSVISIYPLMWMFFTSLKNNEEIFVTNPFGIPLALQFRNYTKAVTTFNIPVFFKNSVIISILTIVLTMAFVILFSYATARMKWKGSTAVRFYIS